MQSYQMKACNLRWPLLLLASFLAPRPRLGVNQIRKTAESRVTSQRSTNYLNLSCCKDEIWSAGRRERVWGHSWLL